MKPASIFKRLLAYIIDSMLISIILRLAAEALKSPAFKALSIIDKAITLIPGQEPPKSLKLATEASSYVGAINTIAVIAAVVCCAYFILLEGSKWQGTLGKKLLKLKVVDNTNKSLSLLKALKRYVIFSAPSLVVYSVALAMHPQCLNIQKQLMMLNFSSLIPCLWSLGLAIAVNLVLVVPIFFTKNRTTAYDMLSKTKVVG
jgi:uncharacterized RDD family membrane protein YckC